MRDAALPQYRPRFRLVGKARCAVRARIPGATNVVRSAFCRSLPAALPPETAQRAVPTKLPHYPTAAHIDTVLGGYGVFSKYFLPALGAPLRAGGGPVRYAVATGGDASWRLGSSSPPLARARSQGTARAGAG